ncbi:hypothetical protein [Ferrimonas gelatinilytica]
MQLGLFLLCALLLSLLPVYGGARLLGIGNPSWWAALAAVVAALALQDLALRFLEDQSLAWLVSLLAGAIAFSLMLDCPYWKALPLCIVVMSIQWGATELLLEGVPAHVELSRLVGETQKELWPQYHE